MRARSQDERVTSPKLLLAAGSVAASLAGIGPAVTHGGTNPVHASGSGVAIAATVLRADAPQTTRLSVPAGATKLVGTASGSPALARATRLTVTRAGDHALLFTGTLATFRSLPVRTGTTLVVAVSKPTGYAGLKGSARLQWS